MNIRNEKGAVLITMLLLLIVITLAGIIAINVSTVDIQIARYTRESSMTFGGAEAGSDLAIPVIENILENGSLPTVPSGYSLDTDYLDDEVDPGDSGYESDPDTAADSPDLTIADINGVEVKVDIDRLYKYTLPGTNIGFASGYEGTGQSAVGSQAIVYRIDAQASRE